MKTTSLVLVASLFITADFAHACGGHRRRCGSHVRTVATYQSIYTASPAYPTTTWAIPTYSYQPAYTYPTVYHAAPVMTNPPAPPGPVAIEPVTQPLAAGVQPTYSYQADPNGPPAYYYTYDDSGNLIIKQWMDWLFRGGRRAGMPMPPLPVVGRLGGGQ